MKNFKELKKGDKFIKLFSNGKYLIYQKISKDKAKIIANQGYGDKSGIENIYLFFTNDQVKPY